MASLKARKQHRRRHPFLNIVTQTKAASGLSAKDTVRQLKARSNKTKLARFRDKVAAISDIVTGFSKISYMSFIVIGIWFLLAYTVREGSPMPAADASLLVFIAIFAAWGLVGLAGCAILLTLPAYARFWLDNEMRAAAPGLFQTETPPNIKNAIGQYIIAFLPFIFTSAEFGRYFIFYEEGDKQSPFTLPYVAIMVSSIIVITLWSVLEAKKKLKAIYCIAWLNIASIGWVAALWSTFISISSSVYADSNFSELDRLKVVVAAFMAAYIFFHFMLNLRLLTGRQWAGPALFSAFLLVLVAGPSFFGALSLRLLGYGGGVIVHLTERTSSGTPLIDDNFCLVLRTSKETMYKDKAMCGDIFGLSTKDKPKRFSVKVTSGNVTIGPSTEKLPEQSDEHSH